MDQQQVTSVMEGQSGSTGAEPVPAVGESKLGSRFLVRYRRLDVDGSLGHWDEGNHINLVQVPSVCSWEPGLFTVFLRVLDSGRFLLSG